MYMYYVAIQQYGKPFTVKIDQKLLEMINHKNLPSTPPKHQMILMQIQGYHITNNLNLKRLPNKNNNNPKDLDISRGFVQFRTDKLTQVKEKKKKRIQKRP